MTLTGLYQQLSEDNVVIPYLENAFAMDLWPDQLVVPMKPRVYEYNEYFFPSVHAVPDARYLYYQLHPVYQPSLAPQKRTTTDKLRMLLGEFLHHVVQEKMKTTGLVTDDDIEVRLNDKEIKARGRADLVIPNHPQFGEDVVIDIKTTNSDNYSRVTKPSLSWVLQVLCYMKWLSAKTGRPVNHGAILMMEAGGSFRTKEFRIDYDVQKMKELYDKWWYVRECLDRNQPPEAKCCGLNSTTMAKCNARAMCLETY